MLLGRRGIVYWILCVWFYYTYCETRIISWVCVYLYVPHTCICSLSKMMLLATTAAATATQNSIADMYIGAMLRKH